MTAQTVLQEAAELEGVDLSATPPEELLWVNKFCYRSILMSRVEEIDAVRKAIVGVRQMKQRELFIVPPEYTAAAWCEHCAGPSFVDPALIANAPLRDSWPVVVECPWDPLVELCGWKPPRPATPNEKPTAAMQGLETPANKH